MTDKLGVGGVLVLQVRQGSPAARAGLQSAVISRTGELIAADVILAVDGRTVSSLDDLLDALDAYRAGDQVLLQVYRGGQVIERPVVLGTGTSGASPRSLSSRPVDGRDGARA